MHRPEPKRKDQQLYQCILDCSVFIVGFCFMSRLVGNMGRLAQRDQGLFYNLAHT